MRFNSKLTDNQTQNSPLANFASEYGYIEQILSFQRKNPRDGPVYWWYWYNLHY